MVDYKVFYPSSNSIGFQRIDNNGKKSSFYLYVVPIKDGAEKLTPLIVVDSEVKEEKKFFRTVEPDAKTVIKEYHKWASDAPMDHAIKIGDHLGKYFRTSKVETEKSVEGEIGTDGAKVKGRYKKKKQSNILENNYNVIY
jgi:hypothetical protein